MGPREALRSSWRRYADFDGRARRSEFWWFSAVQVLCVSGPLTVGWIVVAVALLVGSADRTGGWLVGAVGAVLVLLGTVAAALLLVPYYAVAARRLHDTDRSLVWLLLLLAPYAGFVLLWFWAEDGRPGPNRFGPDPKGRAPLPWSAVPARPVRAGLFPLGHAGPRLGAPVRPWP